MGFKTNLEHVLRIWREKKIFKYIRVRCEVLSECIRSVETLLNSKGINYIRLIDPDRYLLVSMVEPFYTQATSIWLIELRDELSRAFYIIGSSPVFNPKEIPGFEFTLTFKLRKAEGLAALLGLISEGKVGGIQHKHRSTLNLLTSFFGSLLISNTVDFGSYWLQLLAMILLTVILYLVLDYPFSLLYFKGVEVASSPEVTAGTKFDGKKEN